MARHQRKEVSLVKHDNAAREEVKRPADEFLALAQATSRVMSSAYERWTWQACHGQILSLKRRLGYGERLWVLGFELEDDGRLIDPFHGIEVFDPASVGPATTIPARYSAVPEMYCLLSAYAAASEIPLSGEWLSLVALDRVHRPELAAGDCAALLQYAEQDLALLQAVGVPFLGQSWGAVTSRSRCGHCHACPSLSCCGSGTKKCPRVARCSLTARPASTCLACWRSWPG